MGGLKKWLDQQYEQTKFAIRGLVLATREKSFWLGFIPTFCIFGTLLNLLAGGFAAFNLIGSAGFPGGLKIIGDAFLQTFGINRNFVDWLGIFLMSLLQAILIGLLVVVIKNTPKTRTKAKGQKASPAEPGRKALAARSALDTSASAQNSGIVAFLAILGSGCPTCGTALLTPLLTTVFGSGVALAGTVSVLITWLAILLALFTIKKLGLDAYVVIVTKNSPKKRAIIEKRSVDEKGN